MLAMDREGYPIAKWLNQRGIAAFVLKYRVVATDSDFKDVAWRGTAMTQRISALQPGRPRPPFALLLSQQQREAMDMAREDALDAMRYLRSHAAHYGISPRRIGIVGFSAGAITALNVVLSADDVARPDLVAPIYGAMPHGNRVPSTLPPAFIVAASDDRIGAYSVDTFAAWQKAGASAELHVFERGGHGFGMVSQGTSSDQWPALFDQWLKAHGFEK